MLWVCQVNLYRWGLCFECSFSGLRHTNLDPHARESTGLGKDRVADRIRAGDDGGADIDTVRRGADSGGDEDSKLGAEGNETPQSHEISEIWDTADEARKASHRVEVALSRLKAELAQQSGLHTDRGDGTGEQRRIIAGRRVKRGNQS